jgi:phosphatidylinositol 3-kinase
MKNGKPEWQERRAVISRQQKFIAKLVEVVKTVAKESANRQKKMEKLQMLLRDENSFKTNFAQFEPLPFPLDPEIRITGIISKE